jgi:hypothetical protein
MTILGLGMDMNGGLLFPPIDEKDALKSLQRSLERNASALRSQSVLNTRGFSFRGEAQRRVKDVGDPREAGWTFLVAENDPRRASIVEIMKPLAVHRGMKDPSAPLIFGGEADDRWGDWLQDKYWAAELEGSKAPAYVLLVGDPARLPFRLQSLMDTVANVGRLDFDSPTDLEAYVKKVVRLETAPDPAVKREVIVFATDGGPNDPTHYSRQHMAEPLSNHIQETLGFRVTSLIAADASKTKLQAALEASQPALVYTASHGLGQTGRPLAEQKRFNGALCCQSSGPLTLNELFCAEDVPSNRPFLEGAVFFQFACFGGGTPAQSDYTHWLEGVPENYADEDFVAALPKRLLAHPRGPVAFVGHLDTAWMHGFTDAASPDILERWHNRMAPFVHAIDEILSVQPAALGMQMMNDRYTTTNAILSGTYDRQRRGTLTWTDELAARFIDTWIIRSDAQNYMVLGDPAARLRIPLE